MEPLLTAVTDSVATGYQALEHVIEGLRESVRLQAGPAARAPAKRPALRPTAALHARPGTRTDGAPNPAGLVQDFAAIVADALGVAGTLVQDVAQAIGEQSHGSGGEGCLPTLALCAPAGATATTSFTVWNTGPTLLTDLQLSATDLIGAIPRSPDGAVTFTPVSIAQIAPGKGEAVEISVAIAADTLPGLRRGLVVATPGDACAVLELTVTAAPPLVVARPAERPAPDREPGKPPAPDVEAS